MDKEGKPVPINIDLADDHYDHQGELVDSEPEGNDDPPVTPTVPEVSKKA